MVFQALNKLVWQKKIREAEVVILHRGAPDDRKTISGRDITHVSKHYFYYMSPKGEVCIPLHRVLEVWVRGKCVWRRKA